MGDKLWIAVKLSSEYREKFLTICDGLNKPSVLETIERMIDSTYHLLLKEGTIMPMYDYECSNHGNKPYAFEGIQPMSKSGDVVECPKCNSKEHVKKVLNKKPFPKSQSWRP